MEREGYGIYSFCMMPGFVVAEMTDYLVATPERFHFQKHVPAMKGSAAEFPPEACAEATMKLV